MFVAELAVATAFYYMCLRFCAQLMPSGKSRVWLWVSVVLLVGLIATLNLMDMYGIAIMPAVWVLLALGMMASLGVGSNPIPPGRVWQLLWAPDGSFDAVVPSYADANGVRITVPAGTGPRPIQTRQQSKPCAYRLVPK